MIAGLCRNFCLRVALGVLLIIGITIPEAGAQALPTASGPGMSIAIGGGYTAMESDYGQRLLGGGMGYLDANLSPSFSAEGEVKFLRMHTDEDVNETTYLAGIKYALPNRRMQPYVKVLAGVGEITFPFHYATGSYLVIAPGAGLDYHFAGRLTARIIDFQYQDWPQFSYGALHPYGISAGFSFRVTGIEQFPKGTRHRH
jgi:hypothetical protein